MNQSSLSNADFDERSKSDDKSNEHSSAVRRASLTARLSHAEEFLREVANRQPSDYKLGVPITEAPTAMATLVEPISVVETIDPFVDQNF